MDSRVLLLVFFGPLSWSRGEDQQITAVSGSNVTFTADVSTSPSEISWAKDMKKIVELERGQEPFFYGKEDRIRITADLEKGTLTLKNVTPSDSGLYNLERLVAGTFLPTLYYRLQVYDPVCPVQIHLTSMENNVTLHCICSGHDAPPSQYEWIDGTGKSVSRDQNITVQKKEMEQSYRCNASNAVSSSNATVIVPAVIPDGGVRKFPVVVIILVLLFILLIILCGLQYKYKIFPCLMQFFSDGDNRPAVQNNTPHPPPGDNDVENQKPDKRNQETEPLLYIPPKPSRSIHHNNEKQKQNKISPQDYVSQCVRLYLKFRHQWPYVIIWKKLENGSTKPTAPEVTGVQDGGCMAEVTGVQPGTLRITSVQDGEYKAEVTRTIEGQEDQGRFSLLAVREPAGGALTMNSADRIVCNKDGGVPLIIPCSPDPLLQRLTINEGGLGMDLVCGDKVTYVLDVSGSDVCCDISIEVVDGSTDQEMRKSEAEIVRLVTICLQGMDGSDFALDDIILCPVYVGNPKKITWKKAEEILAQWAEGAEPQYTDPDQYALSPTSGNLTIRNVEQRESMNSGQDPTTHLMGLSGSYVMEAEGDRATTQEVILRITLK